MTEPRPDRRPPRGAGPGWGPPERGAAFGRPSRYFSARSLEPRDPVALAARLREVRRVGRLCGAAVDEDAPLPQQRVGAPCLDVAAAVHGGVEIVQRERQRVDSRRDELLAEA